MCANKTVAVIDIGSNSIKLLVARPGLMPNSIETIFTKTIKSRIGTGIGSQAPKLTEEAMTAGCKAIVELITATHSYCPEITKIVATSAVRDAVNAHEFTHLVERETGLKIRVLSGSEEAIYICKGLLCDPQLSGIENFIQMDIGGGSLELVRFTQGTIQQACSLQLGAVRLTEQFVTDPTAALTDEIETNIRNHVENSLKDSGFDFGPDTYPFIVTGGAFVIARALLTAQIDTSIQETSPVLRKQELIELKSQLVCLPLDERIRHPGLPADRADIIPTALITIIQVLDYANRDAVSHSFYNLRYGIATEPV